MVENSDCSGTSWYFVLVVQEKPRHSFTFHSSKGLIFSSWQPWLLGVCLVKGKKIMNETIFLCLNAFLKRLLRAQME